MKVKTGTDETEPAETGLECKSTYNGAVAMSQNLTSDREESVVQALSS
jgi:hypothetical protein